MTYGGQKDECKDHVSERAFRQHFQTKKYEFRVDSQAILSNDSNDDSNHGMSPLPVRSGSAGPLDVAPTRSHNSVNPPPPPHTRRCLLYKDSDATHT